MPLGLWQLIEETTHRITLQLLWHCSTPKHKAMLVHSTLQHTSVVAWLMAPLGRHIDLSLHHTTADVQMCCDALDGLPLDLGDQLLPDDHLGCGRVALEIMDVLAHYVIDSNDPAREVLLVSLDLEPALINVVRNSASACCRELFIPQHAHAWQATLRKTHMGITTTVSHMA